MMKITSVSNKTYKFIKSLAMKKERSEQGCFVVEGVKSVLEVLASDTHVRMVVINESASDRCVDVVAAAQKRGVELYEVSDKIFAPLCDTKTPEGALCVADMHTASMKQYKDGLYLYCDNVSDPGNAGTLIRCADAVGASGVFFSHGSVDIYNPKTVRATMGSLFHLPVYDGVDEKTLCDMKKSGYKLFAGALTKTAEDYRCVEYQKNTVIIIGNEANGVSETVLSIADVAVIIPIAGRAESLNASVAGSILMYEWRRNN